MLADTSRANPGATAQKKRPKPMATMRLRWAVLGSVNHQARAAQTTRTVGSSVCDEGHDISVWCDDDRKRKRNVDGRGGRRDGAPWPGQSWW